MHLLVAALTSQKRSVVYLMIVLLLGALSICLDVAINDRFRIFYNALVEKNPVVAYQTIGIFFVAYLTLSVFTAVNAYFSDMLDAVLRNTMSLSLFRRATADYNIDRIKNAFGDQRIAEDIEIFTSRFAVIGITSVLMLGKASVFFVILWQLSPPLYLLTFNVTGSLSIAAVLYFCAPTAASYILGRRLYLYENKRRKAEARLRYTLITKLRSGTNADSPNFYRALSHIFILTRIGSQIHAGSTLISFSFSALSALVPMFMLLPFYFSEQIAFGEVIKASAAFTVLQSALSYLYSNSREVVRCLAALRRVGTFANSLAG